MITDRPYMKGAGHERVFFDLKDFYLDPMMPLSDILYVKNSIDAKLSRGFANANYVVQVVYYPSTYEVYINKIDPDAVESSNSIKNKESGWNK